MKESKDPFERVMVLARRAEAGRRAEASPVVEPLPPGFATRVAARWASRPEFDEWDLWDRLSRCGLGLAVAVCVVAFCIRGKEPEPPPAPFEQWVMGAADGGRS